MNTNRKYLFSQSVLRPASPCIIALILCVLVILPQSPEAAEQNTAYLPLQIVAPQTDSKFISQVDSSLASTLARNDILMIERQLA
ncbi:MAG: hypothetical protein KJO32_18090, partial [Deltaproteobacteria bacterium]|nr:hypothetical protein [Deltaproteobacteria bacterium]